VAKVVLAFFLALCAPVAVRSAPDTDTVAMVQAFLKMPTEKLPAEHIPRFLSVDPETLPAKLRRPFIVKRLELYTLKQLADGRKRGSVRMPEENCDVPKDAKSNSAAVLKMAGYEEILEGEESWVIQQTKCTEHDLLCEFSLQILLVREGQSKRTRRLLFLHEKDPLFALVAQYREGHVGSTKFFGIGGFPSCAPRLK